MIKCPKCDGDNLIGAIFCRTCGAKLEINNLRPETGNETQAETRNVKRTISRIITLAILALVLGVLGLSFLRPTGRTVTAATDAERQEVEKLFDGMFLPLRAEKTFTFTAAQLSALANTEAGLSGASTDKSISLSPELLEIDCIAGYLIVTLRSRIAGKVAVYSRVLVALDLDAQGAVTVRPVKAQAGRLSLPGAAQNVVIQRIKPLFTGNRKFDYLKGFVQKIEISDGSLAVTMKATAKDKTAMKALQELFKTQ